jgi:hypothetical protein
MIAQILTPYIGDGSDLEPYRPLVSDRYSVTAWTDVTGTPNTNIVPTVNLYVVQIVCDEPILDAIADDSDFAIIWSEDGS